MTRTPSCTRIKNTVQHGASRALRFRQSEIFTFPRAPMTKNTVQNGVARASSLNSLEELASIHARTSKNTVQDANHEMRAGRYFSSLEFKFDSSDASFTASSETRTVSSNATSST